MSFLKTNFDEIVMDTFLTDYGRQKLAVSGSLGIKKFAISDDGIDYTELFETTQSIAITKMPLLQPIRQLDIRYPLYPSRQNKYKSELLVSSSSVYIDEANKEYEITVEVKNLNISDEQFYLIAELNNNINGTLFLGSLDSVSLINDDFNENSIVFKSKFNIYIEKLPIKPVSNILITVTPSQLLMAERIVISVSIGSEVTTVQKYS
jgi:hypothetical protein